MIQCIDRVRRVVQDPERAARVRGRLLEAHPVRADVREALCADRMALSLGASEVDLQLPSGPAQPFGSAPHAWRRVARGQSHVPRLDLVGTAGTGACFKYGGVT